jgi:hypothetical protein
VGHQTSVSFEKFDVVNMESNLMVTFINFFIKSVCKVLICSFYQGGETGIGKMAAEKVWVPPEGRGERGGILNKPRRQMSFLSSSDSCELAPLRVCELASILCDVLCVSFRVMPRMLGKFPESFRLD